MTHTAWSLCRSLCVLCLVGCASRPTPTPTSATGASSSQPTGRAPLPTALRRTAIPAGVPTDAQLHRLALHDATRRAGAALFVRHCRVCHGDGGRGRIGPNLTDNHQLHGTTLADLFHTIHDGVPSKGMVSWRVVLAHDKLVRVAAYVGSLRGTFASAGKAPQGKALPTTR